jgi:hypothetical protein
LKPGDLRAFPRNVRRVLLELVNNQGVKCRMPNGTHILLYPPDGESRPFKVSASRGAAASLTFIEDQFVKPHHLEMP